MIKFDTSNFLSLLRPWKKAVAATYSCLTYETFSILVALTQLAVGLWVLAPGVALLIPALDAREFYVPEDTEDVTDRKVLDDMDSMRHNMTRMKMDDCNGKGKAEFMWSPFLHGSFYLIISVTLMNGVLLKRPGQIGFWVFMSIMEIMRYIWQIVINAPLQNFSRHTSGPVRAVSVISWSLVTYIVWRTYKKLKTEKCSLHDDPVCSAPTLTQTSSDVCADNPNNRYGVSTM